MSVSDLLSKKAAQFVQIVINIDDCFPHSAMRENDEFLEFHHALRFIYILFFIQPKNKTVNHTNYI